MKIKNIPCTEPDMKTKTKEIVVSFFEFLYTIVMMTIFGVIGYALSILFHYSTIWIIIITFSVSILGTVYITRWFKRIGTEIYKEFKEYDPSREKRKVTR